MVKIRSIAYILAILIVISFLLPAVKVGSTTWLRIDRIVQIFTLPIIFMLWKDIKSLPLTKKYLQISIVLMGFMILSDAIGSIYFLNEEFKLTIRPFLIFAKTMVYIYFIYLVARDIVKINRLQLIVSWVFIIGMIIGVLQYFDIGNISEISLKYYVLSSTQESNFLRFSRVFGTSGAIISWAGCCVIIFYYFFFVIERPYLKILGAALAAINILGAASRAGIIALAASFIIIQLIKIVIVKRNFSAFFKTIGLTVILFIGAFFLANTYLPEQVEFLEMRFDKSEDAFTTEGRGPRIIQYFGILNQDLLNYIFGIGSTTIAVKGHLEVDPVFIITAYGIVGFLLHYLLIYLLVKKAYQLRNYDHKGFLFVMASTIASLIFSAGFFFLHELYMGLAFWWLNGIVIGCMYRNKARSFNSKKVDEAN